ncbi:DUF6868 family protein [Ilyobacter polytropus]|uniref:DUF6868 domain-containing protein n=1 Tax=Ilyobacter polytropus (strain ATCC 51220 / DSM 2926 / LMG 16218 / CuHBu1) TaxID=572544 RepID=E3HCQ5_ILYPC|nr:hypothetical protein [Ilyobacter polytropus]ADO84450.1 conserved hypothetical protein [Ilyobacter polytropus DSM 2926]
MNIKFFQDFFLWCTIINSIALFFWMLMFIGGSNWIYQFHSRWFKISLEEFHAIHYKGMAFYKLGIFLFNLAPYIVLLIIE